MNQLSHCFYMVKKTTLYFIMLGMISAQSFSIARIHYSGGGDWYSAVSYTHLTLPTILLV